ncbi:MAG: ABC transporter ATP-binding protein [Methylobacteriaceae bacterium]|jgi:peptide/nickel transport system ATP-binding protein|nr:ABC transporter ATP-binding protein [Methylobacteriaceae bacterium]
MTNPALSVIGLETCFRIRGRMVPAVSDVDLFVDKGEIIGLVGESGSGKSVTGLSIMGLIDKPGEITKGKILLNGEDLVSAGKERLRQIRGARIAMIFQDPMMTLNPVLRIDTQMMEALSAHDSRIDAETARTRCRDALGQVGIPSPEERLKAYPHQFSGGMRQRVAIAIALLNRPDIIIADEPTTALDVTIQGQILSEMQKLCRDTGAGLVWITHDLTVVAGLTTRVYVMYGGRIVELGAVDDILDRPIHPYTRGLIRSVPWHNRPGEPLYQIPGMTPAIDRMPAGCRFHPRCALATPECRGDIPLSAFGPGRFARCVHPLVEDS